ncbi:hypothetical protein ACFQU2_07140 [Siccirubricoccus deserti]
MQDADQVDHQIGAGDGAGHRRLIRHRGGQWDDLADPALGLQEARGGGCRPATRTM